jgi:hypothetical protein
VVHLRAKGFEVETRDVDETALAEMKTSARVPAELRTCHTAIVGAYAVEGHVPAADIERLLDEKPAVLGLAVPGMPAGSPGMEAGDRREPFAVFTFDRDGRTTVFARH